MTREEMRMQLWVQKFKDNMLSESYWAAAQLADHALAEFDKRFPLSEPEQVSLPIREIKDTGELGMTLDTENPWIKCNDKFPHCTASNDNVEVLYADATTDYGWYQRMTKKWATKQDFEGSAIEWPDAVKQVVAWREIKKTENQ